MITTLIVPNVNAFYHSQLEKRLCQQFGGFTATLGQGGWQTLDGRVICEPVTIYTIAASAHDDHFCNDFRDLAREIARDLEQECVYLSFSTDNAEFIAP